MKQELRDKWVADLRTNAPEDMARCWDGKSPKFGMNSKSPCALARVLILGGIEPDSSEESYELFCIEESPFYLGDEMVKPHNSEWEQPPISAVYGMSDGGVPSKIIADWIEANIPVTP